MSKCDTTQIWIFVQVTVFFCWLTSRENPAHVREWGKKVGPLAQKHDSDLTLILPHPCMHMISESCHMNFHQLVVVVWKWRRQLRSRKQEYILLTTLKLTNIFFFTSVFVQMKHKLCALLSFRGGGTPLDRVRLAVSSLLLVFMLS